MTAAVVVKATAAVEAPGCVIAELRFGGRGESAVYALTPAHARAFAHQILACAERGERLLAEFAYGETRTVPVRAFGEEPIAVTRGADGAARIGEGPR